MGLETGTYISDLNPSNPAQGDLVSAGDDHLRLIKSTIKATFPNITGAVTPTQVELNYVAGVTSAIQTQLNAKADTSHTHTEAQITDGNVFPRIAGTETITGSWNFTGVNPRINNQNILHALSAIPESQITIGGGIFARLTQNHNVSGTWNFGTNTPPLVNGLGVFRWVTAGMTSARVSLFPSPYTPPSQATPGDIVLVY